MRPLTYDFQDDPLVETLCDQAMVGRDVLVAPVVRPGANQRAVYLPAGEWVDLWTLERLAGPAWHLRPAPLDTLPLFVRAGAVLPRGPWATTTDELPPDRLELHVYPGPVLNGEWYDDDGRSLEYQLGAFEHWRFSGSHDGDRLRLRLERLHAGQVPQPRKLMVYLHGVSAAHHLTFNGESVAYRADGAALRAELRLEAGELSGEGLIPLD